MPKASVRSATIVKPALCASIRTLYCKSCRNDDINDCLRVALRIDTCSAGFVTQMILRRRPFHSDDGIGLDDTAFFCPRKRRYCVWRLCGPQVVLETTLDIELGS